MKDAELVELIDAVHLNLLKIGDMFPAIRKATPFVLAISQFEFIQLILGEMRALDQSDLDLK